MPGPLLHDETIDDGKSRATLPAARALPHLFIAMECTRPLAGSARHALANIDEVLIGRGPARAAARIHEAGVRKLVIQIGDPRISLRHARLVRRGEGWELEDLGSRNGSRVDGEPVSAATPLRDGARIWLGHSLLTFRAHLLTWADDAGDIDGAELAADDCAFTTLIPELAHSFATLARVAKSNVPVLLAGETGSGKELLARAVHAQSGRKGEFVAINCGALPQTLLEAQLFGHVKGAFSGATRDERGYVRAADGGTLFLDEVGELPAASQVALLRVLQEQEVTPVGATRAVAVDVRVVSATNAPIDELVQQGAFRSDLFARLAGFRFMTEPLRARREDLGLLIARLLAELAPQRSPVRLEPAAAEALFGYAWPRNVRELKQCIASAIALSEGQAISLEHLAGALRAPLPSTAPASTRSTASTRDERALRTELVALFAKHEGNVSEVARRMGKARTQIQRWMARFAIDATSFRGAASSTGETRPNGAD